MRPFRFSFKPGQLARHERAADAGISAGSHTPATGRDVRAGTCHSGREYDNRQERCRQNVDWSVSDPRQLCRLSERDDVIAKLI